jgi:hypothetical protein
MTHRSGSCRARFVAFVTCVAVVVLVAAVLPRPLRAQAAFDIFSFDTTAEGPWSDIDDTTLEVPRVPDGSVTLDGSLSSAEYGGFTGVEVLPDDNGWLLDFPGDRSWDGAEDSSFTFYLAHDEDFLYIGLEVLDDVVTSDDPNASFWRDDAVEIIVDALNDRYDTNTDSSMDRFGGHCYFNYEGRFSEWDDDAELVLGTRWATGVDWFYGDGDADQVYGFGEETGDGWALEVRFHKELFEDPDAGNELGDGYVMGFNIGLDDDDQRGVGPEGSLERSADLELQYWWANRLRPLGWTAEAAAAYTEEEIEERVFMADFPLGIDSGGRLTHGGTGEIVFAPAVSGGSVFKRGDVDGNGALEITDPIANLTYQFVGDFAPPCLDALDWDDNGAIDVSDPIGDLSRQFLGGAEAPAPGSVACGPDPTADGLDCATGGQCD